MPFAQNGDIRLHYETIGSGPSLTLVHGQAGDSTLWEILGYTERLKHDYRLILVDARGFGESDRPHDPDAYSPQNRVGDVVAVLNDLGLEQCNYIGLSNGGYIAFDICLYAPEKLRSLVVIGAAPVQLGLQDTLDLDSLREISEASKRLPFVTTEQGQRLADMFLQTDVQVFNAIAESRPYRPWDRYNPALMSLACPALFICGTDDPRHNEAKKIAESMPTAEFVSLEGTDHMGSSDMDKILPAVSPFLKIHTNLTP